MVTIAQSSSVLRFDGFEVDLHARELRKNGTRIKLQDQPFQVLCVLLEHHGQTVGREELKQKLWPSNTFVDFDDGLNTAIKKLRNTLSDSVEYPRYIETIPRHGYRFIASMAAPSESPSVASVLDTVGAAPALAVTPEASESERQTSAAVHSQYETSSTKMLHGAWRKALLAAAVLLIAAAGVWWRPRVQPRHYAIAVLPFKNLSAEPNGDYFSDGLTDEVIRDLSTIEGLQVKSRTSSFLFKDKANDVHDVGKQLGANLLLEGSVLRAGERLRINVDLVRVADNVTLWSQRYDRDLKDVFAVQEEISRSIVNELRLKQVGGQRQYDTNVETYDLYLRAQWISNTMTSGPKLAEAVALYRQVIAQAPDFVPAYADLADVYARLRHPYIEAHIIPDVEQQLRVTAEKAIQLDPLLPEAHGALGLVYAEDLAWSDAERSFQRALQLNRNSTRIHQAYGMFVLTPEGKLNDAVQQFHEAVTLDPLSAGPRYSLALGLIDLGAYDEALENCRHALAANPPDPAGVMQQQARGLWFKGRQAEAITTFEQLGRPARGFLGYAYGSVGRRHEAEQIAAEEDPAAIRHQALIYAGLGERDRVLEAFEKMAAMHDPIVDIYPLFPEFALVRDDARMKQFRRKRNLPWPP